MRLWKPRRLIPLTAKQKTTHVIKGSGSRFVIHHVNFLIPLHPSKDLSLCNYQHQPLQSLHQRRMHQSHPSLYSVHPAAKHNLSYAANTGISGSISSIRNQFPLTTFPLIWVFLLQLTERLHFSVDHNTSQPSDLVLHCWWCASDGRLFACFIL